MLIAFGGPVGGLQEAIEADQDLKVGGDDAAELFDMFIDPNAKSGTRTVRLEVKTLIIVHCFSDIDISLLVGIHDDGHVCVKTNHCIKRQINYNTSLLENLSYPPHQSLITCPSEQNLTFTS